MRRSLVLVAAALIDTICASATGIVEGKTEFRPGAGAATVVLGPSPRLDTIAPLLEALCRRPECAAAFEIRRAPDLFTLLASNDGSGRLLVDGDLISAEDLGFFRRFLAHNAAWSVCVLGEDAGRAAVRVLLGLERTHWIAWPPDVVQLQELVQAREFSRASAPVTESSLGAAASSVAPTAPPRGSVAASTAAAASADGNRASIAGAGSVDLRAQVALLADISQRLELSFSALRETSRGAETEVEGAAGELRQLMRFTRTLSCLIAPPARGEEEFDLVALLEDQLAGLTLRGRKCPRFVPRGPADSRGGLVLLVRADRNAVTWAVEALFSLARQCAAAGEVVRVVYSPLGSEVGVTVEFPAGPLAGLARERLFDAGAIHERLPEYGANDLAAAAAILRSQGGDLSVSTTGTGSLAVQMRLPLLRQGNAPPTAAGARSPPAARATSNDPFA